MRKNELRELVHSGEFITGIYNYCDRWCERCPFTTRCLVYATEKADDDLDDPEAHDINNTKFWSRLESMFKDAHEMILEWAEESGLDLETVDAQAALADRDEQRLDAKEHDLSISARRYAELVQRWFVDEFAVEGQVHDDTTGKSKNMEEDIDISDAIEVIRWYQFFVAAKLFRALMGREDVISEDDLVGDDIFTDTELDEDDVYLDGGGNDDSDGSAKIALIAIERSSRAWQVMQSSLPEKADTIRPMLIELERMRRAAEQTFPQARDFIRPGFDESNSEFVS